jgi:lipid A 4'-phosphatase
MSKAVFIFCLVAILLFSGLFLYAPQIDIWMSKQFYLGHNDFALNHYDWLLYSRYFLYAVIRLIGLIILINLIYKLVKPRSKLQIKPRIFIVLVLIIMPLLVINTGFKDHMHRPRPSDVSIFGADKTFQEIWHVDVKQCDNNCAFVCGDCAAAFTFWMFIPFFQRRGAKIAYGLGIFVIGVFYSWIRIGQGGHFLSDTIFACLFTYIGIYILYWFCYQKDPRWLQEAVLQAFFTKWHNKFIKSV